ncbi:FAD-dependent oxidoreductase [Mycobacterium sp. URHB0044]|jgi:D-amino-acid oxidase|uniref:FAD-dependent oxidoreductase n=1 Tax=Mycobacterium sp. URHB0044 TaxID=1380386 RepID=UPI000568048B|nr:FAD-dependent oxidoreductase [Mycobacterium sp. URHB0044]
MANALQVVVVGSGITGLTSAIALLEAGHEVRVVAAEPSGATTSALAAAVWFPTHVGPWERVSGWGADTFRVLADHVAAGVPGVVMRESLGLYREPPGEPAWTAAVDGVRPAEPDELPPGYRYGLRFAVPLAEMPRYLPWLDARILELGGESTQRHLRSLDEVADDADVVVNCTGLGARELVGDSTLYPVRGQIVRVSNPGLTVSVRDELHPGGRAYVHPRADDCILGGTLDEGQWDTAVDPAVGAAIVERCRDLVPALRDAHVLEHVVGLRPGRPTVRLEEDEPLGSGARVVHNYGHGGAGITLSWGCAREVVALIEDRGR